jgi:putative transposase
MTAYRRNSVAGGSYFFTVNLTERRLRLLTDNIELFAGGVPGHATAPPVHNRRHRGVTGPYPCRLDISAGDADFSIR